MTNIVATWAGVPIDLDTLKNRGYQDPITVNGISYPRFLGYLAAGLQQTSSQIATIPSGTSATAGPIKQLSDFTTGGYVVGTGDDTATFNAAMTSLGTAGGGRLILPALNLHISAMITIPTGVEIEGAGYSTQIFPMTNSLSSLFSVTTGNTALRKLTLVNASALATTGLNITKPYDNKPVLIEDVLFSSFTNGYICDGGDVIRFVRPRFENNTLALWFKSGMLNSEVLDIYQINGNGILIDTPAAGKTQTEGFTVQGGIMLPNTTGDYAVSTKSGLSLKFDQVTVDQLAKTGANGYIIDVNTKDIKITNGYIGKKATASGTGDGIRAIGNAVEGLHIENMYFNGTDGYGINTTSGVLGITSNMDVSSCRFINNGTGDVNLNYVRALFVGCEFNHATISIACGGSQASYDDIACNFLGAQPQSPSLAGGLHLSRGLTTLKLPRELVITSGGFDVTGSSVVRADNGSLTVLDTTSTGTAYQLTISGSSNANVGAAIALLGGPGGGSVVLNKGIRALGGLLQFLANNLTSVIAYLDDLGSLTINGTLSCVDIVCGQGNLGGAWSTFTPTVGATSGSGGTATGSVRYKRFAKIVMFELYISVTSNGTWGGALTCTLPFAMVNVANSFAVFAGRENTTTGKMLQGLLSNSSSTLNILDYANIYPGSGIAGAWTVMMAGTYETN